MISTRCAPPAGPLRRPSRSVPLEATSGDVRALEHGRELVVCRPDVGEEPLPESGELDAASGPVRELGAELVLEPAQTLTDP
jgi:hypothetical protein